MKRRPVDQSSSPPRAALGLLAWRLGSAHNEFLVGDLLEAFDDRAQRHGAAAARRWFWRETVRIALHSWPAPRRVPAPPAEPPMKHLLNDLQFALRMVTRTPTVSLLTILTLALGIGATSAIFSVAYPALFRAAPYRDPSRLVLLWERDRDGSTSNIGYTTFRDLARDSRSIESAAAMSFWQPTVTDGAETERLDGQRVTHRFFEVLGVTPMLGRTFTPEEDRYQQNRSVVISHGLWQRRFGGDSTVLGRTLGIGAFTFTIVGVLPPTFESLLAPGTEIWAPLGYDESLAWACRTCRHLRAVVRLRPDVPVGAAEQELSGLMAGLVRQFPTEYAVPRVAVTPLREYVVRGTRPALLALLGAVLLVTLIACANAANLLLGRALRRESEFAVRTALGASRRRLAGQVVTEGLMLALIAGSLGIVIAIGGVQLLVRLAPPGIPRLDQVRVDGGILVFTLGLSLVAGLAASALPVLAAGRADLHGILKSGARGLALGVRHRLRAALVVSEVALAVMLLAGATLLFQSLGRLLSVNAGFEVARRLTMEVQVTGAATRNDTTIAAFWDAALQAVRTVPGVEDAAIASQLPLGGNVDLYGIHREEQGDANPAENPSAMRYAVTPGYLGAMGISLMAGRWLTEQDDAGAPPVVVVNRTMAERLYPGLSPIGHRVRMGGEDSPYRTIVGVVGNTLHRGLDAAEEMQIYVPTVQWGGESAMTLVVRTSGNPSSVTGAVRSALRSVGSPVAVAAVATMEQLVSRSTAERRFALALFQGFALVALVLAGAGIYGVLSASVVERTREIGIRSALGAPRERILGVVMRQGIVLTAVGVAIGLGASLAAGGLMARLLYGVRSYEPTALLFVAMTLGTLACVACAIPAWRASRVDPVTALRDG